MKKIMYYINSSPTKLTNFSLMTLGLFLLVGATLVWRQSLPAGYLSVDAQGSGLASAIKSLVYGAELGLPQPAYYSADSTTTVPVLLYHGIVKNPDNFSMTPATFKDQMFALKLAGYRTITLEDFYAFEQEGKPLPDKSFLLTFDDGRTDSFVNADPILRSLGFKAVMFVATGDSYTGVDSPDSYYLHEPELKYMLASGRWEIGSHAIQETPTKAGGKIPLDAAGDMGNFLSNRMWLQDLGRLETETEYEMRVAKELSFSKQTLENSLGVKVTAFAYPFSDYGQQSKNNPLATGVIEKYINNNYQMAFDQVSEGDNFFTSNGPKIDPDHYRRIEVPTSWSGQMLLDFLSFTAGKQLPYADSLASNQGWKTTWGQTNFDSGEFDLAAEASTTGALAFLDGTSAWSDYQYQVSGDWQAGETVSLLAGLKDADNFFDCTFGPQAAEIQMVTNGKSEDLIKVPMTTIPKGKVDLSIKFGTTSISCYVGSKLVASSNFPKEDGLGGIGLRIWDARPGRASFALRALAVNQNNN